MAFSENTKTEIQIRKFKAKTILLFFIVITITVGVVYNNKKIFKRDAE